MLLVAVLRVASFLRWFLYLLVLACERYNRENDFLDELVRSMNAPIIGSLSRPVLLLRQSTISNRVIERRIWLEEIPQLWLEEIRFFLRRNNPNNPPLLSHLW